MSAISWLNILAEISASFSDLRGHVNNSAPRRKAPLYKHQINIKNLHIDSMLLCLRHLVFQFNSKKKTLRITGVGKDGL